MHTYILRFFLLFAASATNLSAQIPIYQNPDMPIEVRVEDALSRMTLEEKVALCHAQSKFSSAGVPRLGIPELWMSDGPLLRLFLLLRLLPPLGIRIWLHAMARLLARRHVIVRKTYC